MGNKRLRNVEKRQLKELARALPTPKLSAVPTLSIPVPKPKIENQEYVPLQFYTALESLRLGSGDAITFQLLFSRLMFGRILAHNYFGEEAVAEVHYNLQTIVACAHETVEANGSNKAGDYTNLHMSEADCNEIRECLKLVEEMCEKVTPAEYEISGLKLDAELRKNKNVLTTANMIPYEDFKKEQGW